MGLQHPDGDERRTQPSPKGSHPGQPHGAAQPSRVSSAQPFPAGLGEIKAVQSPSVCFRPLWSMCWGWRVNRHQSQLAKHRMLSTQLHSGTAEPVAPALSARWVWVVLVLHRVQAAGVVLSPPPAPEEAHGQVTRSRLLLVGSSDTLLVLYFLSCQTPLPSSVMLWLWGCWSGFVLFHLML